jgi:hypothetical protein
MIFRVSGMYCRVLKSMSTSVSKVRAASIIRAVSEHERIADYMGVQ